MISKIQNNKQYDNWQVKKIEDIAEVVGGGTPSTKNSNNFGGDIPWITPKDLSEYKSRYISRGKRNLTKQGLDNSSAKILPPNTILLSSRAPVGYTAISANELCTNQGFRNMIPKRGINPEYLYYLAKANTHVFESNASGSTFKELSGGRLKKLNFLIAPEPEQQQIASILSSLDDKIELNRRMNKTLEEIGKALFRRWFVDFEFPNEQGKPYKSSEGKMVDSESGEIPKGWEVAQLKDFGEIICGKTPPKKKNEYFGGDVPFIKIPDMHNQMFIVKTEDSLTQEGMNFQKQKNLPKDSICVSCIATVGLVCITSQVSQTNQQINSIVPNKKLYKEYLYFTLSSMDRTLRDYASGGSATLNLNTGSFSKVYILKPSDEILRLFCEYTLNLFERILMNEKENINLAQTRDSLLPKLMSGKLRVS